jgi:hypothetical protein
MILQAPKATIPVEILPKVPKSLVLDYMEVMACLSSYRQALSHNHPVLQKTEEAKEMV